jgi:rhamnosyltransferase
MSFPDIAAVVVTYRYSYQELGELLDVLHRQLGHIFLIDNNPQPDAEQIDAVRCRFNRCTVTVNHANAGLSKALNQGIKQALRAAFPWLILFDQDSRPQASMIARLLAVRDATAGANIAAFGPCIFDQHVARALPFVRFHYRGVQKIIPATTQPQIIDTDMLITSGCLLSARVLQEIGLMDERLFIDNIDMEWCFRAKAAGYRLLGVSDALLYHRLGDEIRRLPLITRAVLIHSPERQYHMMRNRILLYRRGYVPLAWKIADVPHLLFKLLYFPLFVAPRRENLRRLLQGIRDGLSHR